MQKNTVIKKQFKEAQILNNEAKKHYETKNKLI